VSERGLTVRNLEARYGTSQVLFGIDLDVNANEFVTILGRNGMGKSTIVSSILGILKPASGSIHFGERDITGVPPYVVARAGIGLVPEGRRIFANLTVHENLVATAVERSTSGVRWSLDAVYSLFPRLKERSQNYGNNLSGGEQQMLAIGRALMTNPRLLILDEATEGLAPVVRAEIWQSLLHLKTAGVSLLVIDKNVAQLLKLADRHYVMMKGTIVWSGTSRDLKANTDVLHEFVGV
jgi:branched-chain amino acid transport system ATP-binding protein